MNNEVVIKVDHATKNFKLPHNKNNSVKSAVINFYKRNKSYDLQKALNDVTFEVKKGDFFGIVGRNGSGKSTLLKLLAGIYSPTKGNVAVNGKLIPFIELGVGFSPELTGQENVYLNGALLGFSRKEMNALYKDIVDFAELSKFMNQKLKNYSSGMQVRLAFSIAIRAKSDILLIDEVLAVGDAAFQAKCFDYFAQLKKTDTTVIFVSHDRSSLERFCEKGILLNEGKIIESGDIHKVLNTYSGIIMEELSHSQSTSTDQDKDIDQNSNSKDKSASINNTKTVDKDGISKTQFIYGESISIDYEVIVKKTIINPILGITVWKKNIDSAIYATNTLIEGYKETGKFVKGDKLYFKATIPQTINDGEFYVEPAIANESATIVYDQKLKATTFYISGSNNPHSLISSVDKIVFHKIDSSIKPKKTTK